MRRFLPKSLIGQIALVMAVALLVAQAINFGVIFNERQRATRAQIEAPAVFRFVTFAQRVAMMPEERRDRLLAAASRRGRFSLDARSIVEAAASDARLAERLRRAPRPTAFPSATPAPPPAIRWRRAARCRAGRRVKGADAASRRSSCRSSSATAAGSTGG